MDPELVTLISSGATTLIGLMATDAWAQAKGAAGSLFSRSKGLSKPLIDEELEQVRASLVQAKQTGDSDAEADLQSELRSRLRRSVEAEPELVDELRAFVGKYAETAQSGSSAGISVVAYASGKSKIYQQGSGVQYNK